MADKIGQIRRWKPKALPQFAPAEGTIVLPIAGQNNADGFNGQTWSGFDYTFTNTQTWRKASGQTNSASDGAYQDLVYSASGNTNSYGGQSPDPSIFIARDLELLTQGSVPIKILKTAIAGSSFSSGSTALSWAVGTGLLRNALKEHYIKPGLSKLWSTTQNVWVLPFLWVQGENDANNNTAALAYENHLKLFISDARDWFNLPNLPFVLVRLNNSLSGTYTERAIVNEAFDNICRTDRNCYALNPNGFTFSVGGDNLHYQPDGYESIGRSYLRLARQIGSTRWLGDSSVSLTSDISLIDVTATTAIISATASEYAQLYVGIYTDGSPTPTAANLKAGSGTGYVASASGAMLYNTTCSVQVTGLTVSVNYQAFVLVEDLAGNQTPINQFDVSTIPPPITVTGGTITEAIYSSILYQVHTFLASDATGLTVVGGDVSGRCLVVAGGGSGEYRNSTQACGGGGGGETYQADMTLSPGNYAVVVGAGGAPKASSGGGNSGISSSFNGYTALPGAGGDEGVSGTTATGGGASGPGVVSTNPGKPGTSGRGFDGGSGNGSNVTGSRSAGGGGGSGAIGGNGTASTPGAGGAGIQAWDGNWYGSGGQGGRKAATWTAIRTNGIGGASSVDDAATAGIANTGAGGAGVFSSANNGSNPFGGGGSGIVKFRIPKSQLTGFVPTSSVVNLNYDLSRSASSITIGDL
jgi:hypothetical protein